MQAMLAVRTAASAPARATSEQQPRRCAPPSAPCRLRLLPSGMLVLQDRNGANLWSSQSACLCDRGCYSYRVTDAGTIAVTDANGLSVYRSSAHGPGAARRQLLSASWGGLDCLGAPLMMQVRIQCAACVLCVCVCVWGGGGRGASRRAWPGLLGAPRCAAARGAGRLLRPAGSGR
jgi:hypothetical protein